MMNSGGPIPDQIDRFREMVSGAKRLVAFTGAGISAESGIPTYRGDDGVWNKYDPEKYASIDYFRRDPSYYWSFFKEVRCPVLKEAKPNSAHLALSGLEADGPLRTVITQNIDGLHQEAGSRRVLELHGNTRRFTCLGCEEMYTLDQMEERVQNEIPPVCRSCGGMIRPDVVFFGETLPSGVLNEAIRESGGCDLFVVIGSSLVVQPAASLPLMAREAGAACVIINKDPTPLDRMADLVFHQRASEVLEAVK